MVGTAPALPMGTMADEEKKEAEGGKSEAQAEGGGKGKLVLVLVLVNLLAVGGLGAFVVLGQGGAAGASEGGESEAQSTAPPAPPAPTAGATGVAAPSAPGQVGKLVEFRPIVANLKDPGAGRYVKVTLWLEVPGEEHAARLEELRVPIRDAVLVYFTEMEVERTVGAEAKEAIRKELLDRITQVVGPGLVTRVFFTEFVIQ